MVYGAHEAMDRLRIPYSAENLNEIGLLVSEIWPGKIKVRVAFPQAGVFIRQNTVLYIVR